LAHRAGDVVTQREIEAHLYDDTVEPMSNVVESTLSSLRRKLHLDERPPLIHTRRGQGYIFEVMSE
jgi:DNA-binding response OmpR family regulator